MRILDETTHLIVITIKNYSLQKDTVIVIMDLFKLNVVFIKKLDNVDTAEINKTIIKFYKLYTQNYEFLSDLKKDLTKTSILLMNFSVPYHAAINIKDWWNDSKNLNYLDSLNLVPNLNLLNTDPNNLTKDDNNKKPFDWGDIPQYLKYNVYLLILDINTKYLNDTLKDIDISKFV